MTRSLFATIAASVALTGALAAQGTASVGDTPTYTFRGEVLDGHGLESLEDLRGRPVLVDFWGTNCPPCIGFAVPSAMKLAQQYGDDLAILLVECQGATDDKMASFALGKKWLGNGAMWTTERVFNLGFEGIPHSALLSPEGEIVLAGYTQEIHGQLEEKIAELVEATKRAPADAPKSLHKAWKDFGKGNYANAIDAARKVSESATGDEATRATETIALFEQRIGARIDRAEWQVANGFASGGVGRLAELAKALDDQSALGQRVADLLAKARADGAELDASEALAKLERKLYEEGPDEKLAKRLIDLAEDHEGTRSAARARRLASLITAA